MKWAADEADFSVSEDGEMLDSLIDAGPIVHRESAAQWTRWIGVDEDDLLAMRSKENLRCRRS
jgi:hypothetical protein